MSVSKRRVLLINYDFPPALSGVRRVVKFCEHLPRHGWECAVLCARPYDPLGRDEDAARRMEEAGLPVTRTLSIDPLALRACWAWSRGRQPGKVAAAKSGSANEKNPGTMLKSFAAALRRWIIPDERVGWVPFAVVAGLRIFLRRDRRPDVILTSSFPHSTHLVGLILWLLTGARWVADFRDGWMQNPYFGPPRRGLRRWIHQFLERLVVRNADAVVAVSEPISRHLRAVRGRDGVLTIPNGFDPRDFPDPRPQPEPNLIAYTGTFFGGRSPGVFLRALRRMIDTAHSGEHPAEVRVEFQSRVEPPDLELIKGLDLESLVTMVELGSNKSALERQCRAALLLLIEPAGPNSEIMLTQKVFEYLGSGRPILAMVPPGACRDLLRKAGGAWIVDPDDVEAAAGCLRLWQAGAAPPVRNEPFIQSLTRQEQARQLAALLNSIAPAR